MPSQSVSSDEKYDRALYRKNRCITLKVLFIGKAVEKTDFKLLQLANPNQRKETFHPKSHSGNNEKSKKYYYTDFISSINHKLLQAAWHNKEQSFRRVLFRRRSADCFFGYESN